MLKTKIPGIKWWCQKRLASTWHFAISASILLLALLSSVSTVSADSRDEVVFFFNDALGSAVAAINEAGELCWSENYTAYGDKTINDDVFSPPGTGCGIIGEERGFTGHTEDVNSDLVYMQQRYYDPTIGRFLSIDPMDADPDDPITYNRYAYANNNPYKYVDPDGEIAILAYFATPPGISVLSTAVNWTAGLMGATIVGAAAYDIMKNQSDDADWEEDYEEWAEANSDDETVHGKRQRNSRSVPIGETRNNGEKFYDTDTGATVYVDGSNVVIDSSNGNVTSWGDQTQAETSKKVKEGIWDPMD